MSRWGHAAGLDHGSRASASCYASSGCGGLPLFSRHGCCGVVRRPGLDERLVALATGLVFAPPSPRLSRCFLCLRCTSTGGLGSLACCGGLVFASKINTLFLGLWGACSLGIGEALFLCLWVCLWLSWRRMGWRQTGCFCITTVAFVLLQPQNPLTGWTALFFGAPWYVYYTEFL